MGNKQTRDTTSVRESKKCKVEIIAQELYYIESDLENTINTIAALKRIAFDENENENNHHTHRFKRFICVWK